VHGWNGRGGQLAALARAIAARGHRAVAFDHPAHGESSGRHATIPDMARAIELVSDQLGGAHAVVAHSLGAVAATVAMSRGLEPARAVFLAPPVRPEEWLLRFGRALGLPASSDDDLVRAIEERAGVPVASIRPLDLAPSLDTRLLIVHDENDREVPVVDGEALASVWPGARLVITHGLGHNRLLSSPETVSLVADFIGHAPVDTRPHGAWRGGLRDPHLAAFVERVTIG
jgi:pimeloyl-ACP methyl ester carboxylesterase